MSHAAIRAAAEKRLQEWWPGDDISVPLGELMDDIAKALRRPGRPSRAVRDPEAHRQYMAGYMRDKRAKERAAKETSP